MYLNVSNIQHFSIGDGPGIRSTVFMKGCNLHCPWCHNPETLSPEPQTLVFQGSGKVIHYGRQLTVEEVAETVLSDVDFYRQSGGGVTVSGGEPLLQFDAVAELLKVLHFNNVHTLVDTAGAVPYDCFSAVFPYTDCFYFDWKSSDMEQYKNVIGGDLSLVEENLSRLIKSGKDVHVRIPTIPGFNDQSDDIEQIAKRLKKIGVTDLDILPFHRLANGKYKALGKTYAYENVVPPSEEHIKKIATAYSKFFNVTVDN